MNVLLHMCCGPCAVAVIEELVKKGHEVTGFFFNPNIHPLSEYMRRREAAAQTAKYYDIPIVFGDALPYEEQQWDMAAFCLSGTERHGNELVGIPVANPADGLIGSRHDRRVDVPDHYTCSDEAQKTTSILEELPPAVNPVPWLKMIHGRELKRCPLCWASRLRQTARYAERHEFEAITSSLLYSRYQDHELLKKQGTNFAKVHNLAFIYADYRELWQYGIDRSKELNLYRQPYCGCMLSEYERYAKKLQKMMRE